MRAGYHYIDLKNELNQPLFMPSLLVYTEAQDYIPNEHQGEQMWSQLVSSPTPPTLRVQFRSIAAICHRDSDGNNQHHCGAAAHLAKYITESENWLLLLNLFSNHHEG